MIETIVAITVLSMVGYYAYVAGKQVGSRKGFGAGRYGRKWVAAYIPGRVSCGD